MHPLEDLGVATKAGAEQRTMMEQPPIEQLGSSPADMSNLLSGTKIAAIVLDKDLRVRRYAPQTTEVFELGPDDVGRKVTEITLPGANATLAKDVEASLRDLVTLEREIKSPCGAWYLMRVRPYRPTSELVDGVIVTFVDVTRLHYWEALHTGQAAVLERLARGSPLPEVLATLVQTLESVNNDILAAVILVDAENSRLRCGAAPSMPDEFLRFVEHSATDPSTVPGPLAARHGTRVIIEDLATDPAAGGLREMADRHGLLACCAEPIHAPDGSVLGSVVFFYRGRGRPGRDDIELIEWATRLAALTIERRRSEQALLASEARQSLILGTLPIALYRASTGGSFDGTWDSEQIGRLSGFSPERFTDPAFWMSRIHPDDVGRVTRGFESLAKAEQDTLSTEYRWHCADGNYRWLSEKATLVFDDAGNASEIIGSVLDISKQKWAEQTVRDAQLELDRRVQERTSVIEAVHRNARRHQTELAHVSRISDVGEMASGLAHELSQPLSAVINYAEAGLCDNGSVPASVVLDLTRIVEQANRAATIIRRLQTFVRKNDLTRVEALLGRGIVAQLVPYLKAETQYHGVTLRVAGLDQESPVSANVLEIQHVILILARNGIEAMARVDGDNRLLTIEVGPVADREVEVAISDTGVGFAAEAADRLFDPFYTTKPDGIGLGLSVARTIVEEHGGRLYATQNREAGVTFRMTLPVRGKGGTHGT